MSEDTPVVQDTPPGTAVDSPAAAPVDQAPAAAAAAVDPATIAAITQAVAAALRPDPGPAPVTPTSLPSPAAPSSSTSTTAVAAQPGEEVPYSELFKPGSLAVHTYDHFGRQTHQVLLVTGTYQADVLDKRGNPTGEKQDRVRFLVVGTANDAGDLPADADELLPASQFDWENEA